MRIAVAGKGGSGKSTVAGTLARVLARRGLRVLALDSDFMPGLALSLGADAPAEPPLAQAAERDERGRWRLKRGLGPVRATMRFATPAPDGVLLLQPGKLGAGGLPAIMPAVQAYYRIIHGLEGAATFRDWAIVGDLSAGPRQTAFDWAPYAEAFVVVVEPAWKSVLTARRVARLARARGRGVIAIANKVDSGEGARELERRLGEPIAVAVPLDESVAAAERAGDALIDRAPGSPAARAIERLADRLEAAYPPRR